MPRDTRPVRDDEQLDWHALATWLRWHLADNDIAGLQLDAPMEVARFHGGRSKQTWLVRLGGAELVLRALHRHNAAPVHDVAREFHWLEVLHPLFALAPRPYLLCEDTSVLGRAFSVLERRRGVVVRDDEPIPLAGHPALRRQASEGLVDTLAALHDLDAHAEPLASLGQPTGFLDRQVRLWTRLWQAARLDPVLDLDAVALWLAAHQPPETLEPTVVHGAFTLEHVLLNPLDLSVPSAVLHWDRCALGDPLVDLGALLAHWTTAGGTCGPPSSGPVTHRPGYMTRDELVARYGAASGRDLSTLGFYEVLGVFILAVMTQQALRRLLSAQPDAQDAATLGDNVRALASRARRLGDAANL